MVCICVCMTAGIGSRPAGQSLPWGRLRGGTGGARVFPAWADRNGSASRLPLSRLQLLGAAGTAGGLKQMELG